MATKKKTAKNVSTSGAKSATSNKAASARPKRKLPRCKACDKPIRIPKGWSTGAGVRRHYWKAHREVMLPEDRRS